MSKSHTKTPVVSGVIFRWSYRHHSTGQTVRPKHGRPFPIPVGPRRRYRPPPPEQLALFSPEVLFPPKAPRPPRAPGKVRTAPRARGRRR
ncbi:hypothetical protein [Polyangium fumosum]|uniref:hypothetical protein n=1 Tax=Polyangium fumosum TaxID=889272 RepID=UPI0010AE5279|nr:hypothetical protein [Polyangium fumosum]